MHGLCCCELQELGFCRYDPGSRPGALDALSAPYFFEEPEPADDRTMSEFMKVNRSLQDS